MHAHYPKQLSRLQAACELWYLAIAIREFSMD